MNRGFLFILLSFEILIANLDVTFLLRLLEPFILIGIRRNLASSFGCLALPITGSWSG